MFTPLLFVSCTVGKFYIINLQIYILPYYRSDERNVKFASDATAENSTFLPKSCLTKSVAEPPNLVGSGTFFSAGDPGSGSRNGFDLKVVAWAKEMSYTVLRFV